MIRRMLNDKQWSVLKPMLLVFGIYDKENLEAAALACCMMWLGARLCAFSCEQILFLGCHFYCDKQRKCYTLSHNS